MKLHNQKMIPDPLSGETAPPSDEDQLKVLSAMEKALCRQHFMWPSVDELPCEANQECTKNKLCRSMAEEVLDFSNALQTASKS